MNEVIEKIIKALIVKRRNPSINYTFFMDQLTSYYESNKDSIDARNLEDFRLAAIPMLKKMEHEGSCTINYDASRIASFQVHKYYRQLILPSYKELEDRPDLPFPDLKSFKFLIDSNWMLVFDIKTDFLDTMKIPEDEKGKVVLIQFPEGIADIVLPPEIVKNILFDVVLKKLHLYVRNQNNYAYIGRYLRKAIAGKDLAVKKMMESILAGPGNFKKQILKPNDFSFKFFSYLCNKVIKDVVEKNDKTASDIYTCQALYMLRAFITHFRGLMQKENQKKSDYKELSDTVKKPPHLYSITDMYDLKDKSGRSYSSKYSRDFVNSFIKKETAVKEGEELPYLVRIVPEKRKEYYIQRDMVPKVFLKKLIDSGKEVHDQFFIKWTQNMKNFEKTKEMQRDDIFIAALEECIKNDYKLLNALLNPGLIYLSAQSSTMNENIKNSVLGCFESGGKFKTLDNLLGIDRNELLKEVRVNLPLTYSLPVIGKILVMLGRIFTGKSRKKGISSDVSEAGNGSAYQELRPPEAMNQPSMYKPSAEDKAKNSASYAAAVRNLKKQFLGSESANLNQSLEELSEKWNPLYDEQARSNLVEDVNSLIRDFIRSKKKLFMKYPPDAKRISSLSEDLVNKTSNVGIKKQEPYKQYVELYIIKLLENIKR